MNCDGEPVASGNWVTVKQISGPPNSLVSGLRYLTPSKLEVYIAEPSTTTTPVTGCRNDTAANYNPAATVDGNCIGPPGTTLDNTSNEYLCDAEYMNAGSRALVPNGTVTEACGQRRVRGCMITTAANYNAAANVRDDNSCIAPAGTVLVQGSYVCPYNTNRFRQGRLPDRPFANTADGNCGAVRVRGCTNSTANNYNADANVDDNSCIYSNTDTNFGRNANEQAVYNDVNINGCLVATDISSCTGVKINVNRNVTNNENGASRTLVRHLCCQDTGTSTALENARNAETTLNSAHRTAKTTVGGYSSLNGQTYNNTTSVFF